MLDVLGVVSIIYAIFNMTILTEKPTLYIVARRNDSLEKSGDNIRIKDAVTGELRQKIPALAIRDIVICGDINIDSSVISLAEKHFLPIHFLSNGGKFKGSLVFDFSKNVFLRAQQFNIYNSFEHRLALAKIFVYTKIHNQNVFLQKIRAQGRLHFEYEPQGFEDLMGAEGSIARKYFSFWQSENIIKNSLVEFNGRKKFPPPDPINSLLSFCYTLLHGEIHTQLMIASLDPYIGFLHEQRYGHAALASDFLEIYRGVIEHFVVKSFNLREFDVESDFEREAAGSVKLSRTGFEKFFPKWSDFIRNEQILGEKNLTQIIERDIRFLTHYLMADEIEFEPFLWQK